MAALAHIEFGLREKLAVRGTPCSVLRADSLLLPTQVTKIFFSKFILLPTQAPTQQ